MVEITLTKSELLALLFKLDDPTSAKALVRRGDDMEEYWIQAMQDECLGDLRVIHPDHRKRIEAFRKWEKETYEN